MGELTARLGAPEATDTSVQKRAERIADTLGARVFVDVTIPRTNVAGKMRLLSRSEQFTVKADAVAAMKKFPDAAWSPFGVAREDYNSEIGVRTLAVAVRVPGNLERELGDVKEWRELLDDEQIGALYNQYEDLRVRLDPLGEHVTLTEDEFNSIAAALKKKDPDQLILFGLRKLALFMTTSANRPASSPTPT